MTNGDEGTAQRYRDELLITLESTLGVRLRTRAWKRPSAVPLALMRCRSLLDHYDNAASGGTMDTMTVLDGILRADIDDVAAFAIYDPAAVQQMIEAGVGNNVTLSLGGKLDMPSIGERGQRQWSRVE